MAKLGNQFKQFSVGSSSFEVKRSEGGVVHLRASDTLSLQKGLGYVHAHDRMTQMLFTRVVSQGKITEYLFDSDQAFAIDLLIRKLGMTQDVAEDVNNLSDEARVWCSAYGEGINAYIEEHGAPRLCRLLKIPTSFWRIEDSMLLIKTLMYLGLAQGQERSERFILQALHDGVNVESLKKLFSPHLEKLDSETVELLRSLNLECPYLDFKLKFQPAFSNNWALSSEKSASGKPLCAADPHLQVNRLPAIWYEVILECGDEQQIGITTPGFPGLIMGRSKHLFASFTYGMMDVVDLFVEEIQKNKCKRERGEEDVVKREEVVLRKKKGKAVHYFFETSSGVIERKDSSNPNLADGLYTSFAWSCANQGASPILNALVKLWSCSSVEKAGKIVREVTIPSNWVLADDSGGIAYQQGGRLPKREHSGLFPLPAWKEKNLWQGFVPADQLSAEYNPEKGYVASANDDKNRKGGPVSITIPYSSYRYERICKELAQNKKFTVDEMKKLQCDVYSLQGERFLDLIKDLIPKTPIGDLLRHWDCKYTKESKGATLFEALYLNLIEEVFGTVFGKEAWKQVLRRQSLLVFTHGYFDRVLLSEDESWYGFEGKKECLKRVILQTLEKFTEDNIPTWGVQNSFVMQNIFLDSRLPKYLGFDIGPLKVEGSRATVAASFVFQERKRIFAAAASYRVVTDLATQEAYTALAGGVSERRLSKYYTSDVQRWLHYQYKRLNL